MKKRSNKLVIFLIVLITILTAYIIIGVLPRPQNYAGNNPMRKTGDTPLFIAHGGGHMEFPDNTLEACYNAYSVDKNVMLEIDVSITKDGVVILSHDITLDRKTNVTGAIADWNYSDLMAQKVDFGYTNKTYEDGEEVKIVEGSARIKFKSDYEALKGKEVTPLDVTYPEGVKPRDNTVFLATKLEELMVAFPNNRINVEIKQSGENGKKAFAETLRLLEKYNAWDRMVLASFHDEIYNEFMTYQKSEGANPAFMYSPGTGGATKFFIMQMLEVDLFFWDGISVLQLPTEQLGFNLATKSLIDAAHSHNIAVHYWTIDDVETMKKLVEIGADGIMTNYPHRLKDVYDGKI
ncbi:MAG: hypothetical protein IKM44_03710 [Clostridia bacterium]|nr:hypothetical protein [Clostridia bacterium]